MEMNLPLHPAVVHLPVAIVFLIPLVTVLVALLYKKEVLKKVGLVIIVFFHLLLSGASYIALETGEDEEHTVEKVVSEKIIEEHEDKAETFMAASLVVLAGSVIFLVLPAGAIFNFGLATLLIAQLVLVFLGYQVGHTGGELVYVHGAASAYSDNNITSEPTGGNNKKDHVEKDDD